MTADELSGLRQEHNLSVKELADLLLSRPRTVYQWLNNERAIPNIIPAYLHLKGYNVTIS